MIKFTEIDLVNKYKLRDKIKLAHEYLFYNATLEAQIDKYYEEYQEFGEAKERKDCLEELADMYICAIGIMRFKWVIGSHLIDNIVKNFGYAEEEILLAVINKMNILQHREWEENNGYYKHKVFDIDAPIRESKTNSRVHK